MSDQNDEIVESPDQGEYLSAEEAQTEAPVEEFTPREKAEAESPGAVDADVGAAAHYSAKQVGRVRELIARLYAIRRAKRFYPLDHPAVVEGIDLLAHAIAGYHDEGVDVQLSFFDGEILLGEQLLTEESVAFDQLVRDLTSIGVGSIVFRRGFAPSELSESMTVIAADSAEIAEMGGIEAAISALQPSRVVIGTVKAVERTDRSGAATDEDARAAYSGAVSLLREVDRLMRVNRHMPASKVKGVVRSLVDNVISNRYAMLQLTGLKNYDEYTFYHSANVAILSLALGSMVTQDYRFLSSLGAGALLHDLGKLSVDLEILNKPGVLTPDEWSNVREHPVRGAQMVSMLPGVDKSAVVVILEHHMRFDGTGYPQRTPIRPQHLSSRIVAVADSYDAMTSQRSYSAARVQDEAMSLLAKGAGSALDPVLVRLFIKLMGVYPVGSVVRLSHGQVGIVIAPSDSDPVRPVVRVIASEDGEMIDPMDVDLAISTEISVRGCIDPRLLNIDVEAYL
ncbi:MAG: HD-GYP domain-containing protein [Coriobacteriia bacterium]|nr:HD-GYP domain-containing protein [Coriobacteriia bacterium]